MYIWSLGKSEEGTKSSKAGDTDGCELPCYMLGTKLGVLKYQQIQFARNHAPITIAVDSSFAPEWLGNLASLSVFHQSAPKSWHEYKLLVMKA